MTTPDDDMTRTLKDAAKYRAAQTAKKDKRTGRIVLGVIVTFIVACSWGLSRQDGNDGPPTEGSEGAAAFDACTGSVRNLLKAPSSAEFGTAEAATITYVGRTYTVRGTVDSQNSFGAMIRNEYRCVVTGSGTTWTVNDISGLTN